MARFYKADISIDMLEITYNALEGAKETFASIALGQKKFFGSLKEFALIRIPPQRYYIYEFEIKCFDFDTDDYRKIGHLMFKPINKWTDKLYIRYENEVLYSRMIYAIHDLECTLGLEFYQIRKLDLCVDFNFNIRKYLYQAFKDLNYQLIVSHKAASDQEVHGVWHGAWNTSRLRPFAKSNIHISMKSNRRCSSKDGKRHPKGSRDKALTFKMYNKANEISHSKKHYIEAKLKFSPKCRCEVACREHSILERTLKKLHITDKDLRHNLTNKRILYPIFNHLLFRLIHFKHRKTRTLYTWFDIALGKIPTNE